jgi:hypothetical protein
MGEVESIARAVVLRHGAGGRTERLQSHSVPLEECEHISVIVRRQARVRAEPALLHEMEPAPAVELDQRRVARPRVHAQSSSPERPALFGRPQEDCVDEATAGARRGAGNPMEIEVLATFVRSPDRGIVVRNGEHAGQRVVDEYAEEPLLLDLAEDRVVGELRPGDGAPLPLRGAGVLVGGADVREIGAPVYLRSSRTASR